MLCFPNCKINVGLYVTQRRDDRYHNIETVFYPLAFHEALEVVPADETQLHLSGKQVAGNDTDNLIWKAYQLLHKNFRDKVPPLNIYLHKIIPIGAGLGGGSADGAYMLQLLNDYCHLSLSKEDLILFAVQLGSDCPFFIHNRPKFAMGRGEVMNDIAVNLSAFGIQLICPEVHVSTRDAFSLIKPQPANYDLRQLDKLPVAEWKYNISNDFEAPVFRLHPALADIKEQLYEQGAIYAAMSGSGSCIYGIFAKGKKAEIKADMGLKEVYLQ